MEKRWEKKKGVIVYYASIDAYYVIVGSHAGSGHSDSAGTCSYSEFLEGQYNDLVKQNLGEKVLREMRASVSAASDHKPFQKVRKTDNKRYNFIAGLPEDNRLFDQYKSATQRGCKFYGNKGGYTSKINSTHCDFTSEKNNASISYHDGSRVDFTLPGHLSSVIELDDYFYFIHSDNFAVVNNRGEIVYDTFEGYGDDILFGSSLRLREVVRHGSAVIVKFYWLGTPHKNGLLKFELSRGFTAHQFVSEL